MKLLLFEDEPGHVEMLRHMLAKAEHLEFELQTATTLAEGIEQLGHDVFDLILLDLGLPDSEGFSTFAKVLAVAGDTPIIILSGVSDEELAIQTVKVGAQDYLVKSHLNHHWLIRSIRYALERARVEKEIRDAQADLERRFAERSTALREAKEQIKLEAGERNRLTTALELSNRNLEQAKTQLQRVREDAIQAERLQALGNMAAGIAHDFNNTLTPILGFSEHLLSHVKEMENPKTVELYVSKIHAAANDGAKVVKRLREFYKHRDKGQPPASVALNELVAHVVELTRPHWHDQALAKGVLIEVATDLSAADPEVIGRKEALEEMLTNLIFHGAEGIERSGQIRISTSVHEQEAVLRVVDNGRGIPEGDRAVSRGLSFRKKDDLGIGLGLGAVHEIVRNHGGKVDVSSIPGSGTTVTISLPSRTNGKKVQPNKMALNDRSGKSRLLVVEDEPMVRDILGIYLREDEQREVDFASDGAEGWEKFRTGSYDLVLTDRAMPGLSGDQLALKIKAMAPNVKVILLTGYGELMMSADERPEGVDIIVSKPFTMAALKDAIANALS